MMPYGWQLPRLAALVTLPLTSTESCARQSATEERDGDDDHDGDEGDHDAVFDGGGAALIAAKTGCEAERMERIGDS